MEERAYQDPGTQDPDHAARQAAAFAQWDRATAPTPWWRRRPVQLLAAGAVIAAGVGIYFATQSTAQVHVHGTLTLAPGGFTTGSNDCEGDGGYSDITGGTAVTVGGSTGQTLGIGALSPGQQDDSSNCVFSFDVPVPGGQSVYTVTISHRGTQTVTPAELTSGLALTLGAS